MLKEAKNLSKYQEKQPLAKMNIVIRVESIFISHIKTIVFSEESEVKYVTIRLFADIMNIMLPASLIRITNEYPSAGYDKFSIVPNNKFLKLDGGSLITIFD